MSRTNASPRRWLFLITLASATACGPRAVPAARADDDPVVGAPIDEWLPGSSWSCDAISSLGTTKYVVEHAWWFTDTTWSTDIGERLAEKANDGSLPQFVGQAFGDWIEPNGETWSSRVDGSDHHWFGANADTILIEFNYDGREGTPYRFKIEPYIGTNGEDRAEFSYASYTATYAIDCVQEGDSAR
ncbi:MAG: hypothetical protein ABIO70_20610 [Pseudomonadota bacterium]